MRATVFGALTCWKAEGATGSSVVWESWAFIFEKNENLLLGAVLLGSMLFTAMLLGGMPFSDSVEKACWHPQLQWALFD